MDGAGREGRGGPTKGGKGKGNNKPMSRPLIIPAAYIMKCAAWDRNTAYPVTICCLDSPTSSSYVTKNKEEFESLLENRFINNSNLIQFKRSRDGLHIDVAEEAMMRVKNTILPDIREGGTMSWSQARDFYDLVLKGRNTKTQTK